MLRCPKCGFDISPALRVCGVCQASLDGAADTAAGTTSSPAVPGPWRLGGIVFFLALWPVLATRLGIPPLAVAVVWISAALLSRLAIKGFAARKTIQDPAFGELSSSGTGDQGRVWRGTLPRPGSDAKLDLTVWSGPDGPSDLQRDFLQNLARDLPRLEEAALEALQGLDQTDWPPAAREAIPKLAGIDLDADEDTRDGCFTLEFSDPEEPEAEFYVDFKNGKVVDAYRVD